MNDVPALFYDEITQTFSHSNLAVRAGTQLEGLVGNVFAESLDNAAFQCVSINNGHLFHAHLSLFKMLLISKPTDMNEINDITVESTNRHTWYTTVHFYAVNGEASNNLAILETLSAITPDTRVCLLLDAAVVSVEMEDWIESIRFCDYLRIGVSYPKAVDALVRRGSVQCVDFSENGKISVKSTDLLLELFNQNQFCDAICDDISASSLQNLIDDWSENTPSMVGKTLSCRQYVSARAYGFRKCTDQEERYFTLYYPLHKSVWDAERNPNSGWLSFLDDFVDYWTEAYSKLILRSKGGESAIYCFLNVHYEEHRTLSLFRRFLIA